MLFLKNFVIYATDLFLRFEEKQKRRAPIIYVLISSLCFSLVSLCVKFSLTIPPYQSIYDRAVLILSLTTVLISGGNYLIFTKSRKTNNILLTRGMVSGICLSFFFHALYLLPLSYFAVLQRLTPIYIGILGFLFYKEPYKLLQLSMTFTSLIGVLLIVQPPFLFGRNEQTTKEFDDILLGTIFLVLSNVGVAFIFLTMKSLKNRTNVVVIVFYTNLINLIVSGVGQNFENPKELNSYEYMMVFFSGLLSFFGQLTRSRALLLEKAFLISILTYSQIILSYLFDFLLLDSKINIFGNCGILIVVISMVYLLYKEGIDA